MNKKTVIVEKNKKLNVLLGDYGFSFSDVNKMLRKKDIKVNAHVVKENMQLQSGDIVEFFFSDNMLEKKYEKIFESENVLVIFKFAGIETEGEKGLENVLKAKAVHRLDRNTEGLMIFAKNDESEKLLKDAFKKHKVHKFYVAEVVGCFETNKTYDAFLVKDAENSFVKIYDKIPISSSRSGNQIFDKSAFQPISTKIKTLKAGKETSLLEVELITGKTHQIRAHLAKLGHAIVGDGKYGKNENNKKFGVSKQKLCCFCLKFDFLGLKDLDFCEFKKYPKWLNEHLI